MKEQFEADTDQIEFRVVVDAERASQFAPALAQLALDYDATIITAYEESPEPIVDDRAEIQPFRANMATEIIESSTDATAWVVTLADLQTFTIGRNFSIKLASRAFNTIRREVTTQNCLQNINTSDFLAYGTAVDVEDESNRPVKVGGLRVDAIARLEAELGQEYKVPGYSTRSKELFKDFVIELFTTTAE